MNSTAKGLGEAVWLKNEDQEALGFFCDLAAAAPDGDAWPAAVGRLVRHLWTAIGLRTRAVSAGRSVGGSAGKVRSRLDSKGESVRAVLRAAAVEPDRPAALVTGH